jgi:16S rRNA (guanine527-N7)-methyltransferase
MTGQTVGPVEADSSLDMAQVRAYFGESYPVIAEFAHLLGENAQLRGLMGPRELDRLWSRHLLNCAAVAGFLPDEGLVIDVGSGAGLPGIVIAALRPDLEVELVDSMLRRTDWLDEVTEGLALANVRVTRARAEQLAGQRQAAAVTSRAVAHLETLALWMAPLVAPGGRFLALKGVGAKEELAAAQAGFAAVGLDEARADAVSTVPGVPATWVVSARLAPIGRR